MSRRRLPVDDYQGMMSGRLNDDMKRAMYDVDEMGGGQAVHDDADSEDHDPLQGMMSSHFARKLREEAGFYHPLDNTVSDSKTKAQKAKRPQARKQRRQAPRTNPR